MVRAGFIAFLQYNAEGSNNSHPYWRVRTYAKCSTLVSVVTHFQFGSSTMANVKNIAFNNAIEDGGHFPLDRFSSLGRNSNKRAFASVRVTIPYARRKRDACYMCTYVRVCVCARADMYACSFALQISRIRPRVLVTWIVRQRALIRVAEDVIVAFGITLLRTEDRFFAWPCLWPVIEKIRSHA